MKPIKMLGPAVLAALLAMAFVGVTSTMAESTSLCSGDIEAETESEEEPGSTENECEVSHVHETSVGKAKLLSSSLNVECEVLFLGEVIAEGSPLVISGNFTYSSCNNNCTATEENGPAEIEVLKEGHETATVTGEYLFHLNCSGFINCRYNGEGLVGTEKGPLLSTQTNGEVSISEQEINKESGVLCPATTELDITTTQLVPIYIGVVLLRYCVEYQHQTGGLFQNNQCTTAGAGAYERIWARAGLAVGQRMCILDHNGLWKRIGNTNCAQDYTFLTGGGQEKAIIRRVE